MYVLFVQLSSDSEESPLQITRSDLKSTTNYINSDNNDDDFVGLYVISIYADFLEVVPFICEYRD